MFEAKTCLVCGEPVVPSEHEHPSQFLRRKYCSTRCAGSAARVRGEERRSNRVCAICGSPFSVSRSHQQIKTCRKPDCKAEYRARVSGPKVGAIMRAKYASGERQPGRGISAREEALWPFLREHGWQWRTRWFDDWGCFELDFALLDRNLNVEIDGEDHQWGARLKRDVARDAELQRRGWTVVRIANYQVDADPEGVATSILAL